MSKIPRIGGQGFASHGRTEAPEGRWNVATGASPWSASHDKTQAPEGRQKLMAAIRRPCRGFCVWAILIPRAHARG